MAGIRDIKRRIRSITNTQQITKAMKMVSAAKLRKAQEAVTAARPYSNKLEQVLARLAANAEELSLPLAETRPGKKAGYLVISGDRGLAGGYNANILKLALGRIHQHEEEASVICVGRKGRDFFRRRGIPIAKEYLDIGDNPNFIQAREIAKEVTDMFLDGTFDKIYLVYTEFMTAMSQNPTVSQLLPIESEVENQEEQGEEYIFEPNAMEVLEVLMPRFVDMAVYRVLLEAKASEHGARMTAMGAATDNADDIIDRLTLTFNRARQAAITREISEIVGGAEALN
ncbi:F0F1 ATP synthase subunit gamma [Metallumcola ferriviriculae]|uniref:ATP synthase gamma chain n=1 Tax=Metallumcola ferriviriculae TaxID=3039180 RepID=A0AAU0UKK7_9FIRM|nr:F0F1 ATP synthase subunit gamma [Desulfitibacteraceae bacterium MK1]